MVSLERKSSDLKQNGRWTDEEHELFERAVEIYGKKWKKIEAIVGTRTATQIRSHAQKHFIRLEKNAQTDSDSFSSNSEAICEGSDQAIPSEEAEKASLRAHIQYIRQLNAMLVEEIRKYQRNDQPSVFDPPMLEEAPKSPPGPKLETLISPCSAFKRVKMEDGEAPVVNSANAPQD